MHRGICAKCLLTGITCLWLADINTGWEKLQLQCILGSRGQWEFPPFFMGHRESLCTAITAGKWLSSGLCKETVKESKQYGTTHISVSSPRKEVRKGLQCLFSFFTRRRHKHYKIRHFIVKNHFLFLKSKKILWNVYERLRNIQDIFSYCTMLGENVKILSYYLVFFTHISSM